MPRQIARIQPARTPPIRDYFPYQAAKAPNFRTLFVRGDAKDVREPRAFHVVGHEREREARAERVGDEDRRSERVARRFAGEKIVGKSVFSAKRLADTIGADGPVVDATRDPIKVMS